MSWRGLAFASAAPARPADRLRGCRGMTPRPEPGTQSPKRPARRSPLHRPIRSCPGPAPRHRHRRAGRPTRYGPSVSRPVGHRPRGSCTAGLPRLPPNRVFDGVMGTLLPGIRCWTGVWRGCCRRRGPGRRPPVDRPVDDLGTPLGTRTSVPRRLWMRRTHMVWTAPAASSPAVSPVETPPPLPLIRPLCAAPTRSSDPCAQLPQRSSDPCAQPPATIRPLCTSNPRIRARGRRAHGAQGSDECPEGVREGRMSARKACTRVG
jgi:hypothetical protein